MAQTTIDTAAARLWQHWREIDLATHPVALYRNGEVVTTGVCGKPVPIDVGDRLRADFGEFGVVAVTLI